MLHLKSLHLTGFKAFADSTRLQFGPGITAIVGPNGSGKSNLVDAMLWVLGERGHNALRIGGSTDIIFAGTSQRRALGLAEVSLTLDNSDGALPIEFSEVTVTRRVYRDGESEYLLNKTACRLRDIVELFLDTGVGAGTYSIIGQRDIDAVLSARPEDRRELLEHAAGVQKYRYKRAETKRKLDRTEQNLTRVRDLIHELESQLAPLAAQAEVAREYSGLQARLKQLTLALLAREYAVRVKRLELLGGQRRESRHTLTNAQQKVIALELEERELDQKLRAMEDSIASLQQRTTAVFSQVKATEGGIAVAEERLRSLAEQRERFIQEIGILESRAIGLAQHAESARTECAQCRQIMAEADGVTAAAEQRFASASAELIARQRHLDARKDDYLELMRRVADLRNLSTSSQTRTDNIRRRLEALARVHATIVGEHGQAQGGWSSTSASLEETELRRRQLETDLAQATEHREDLRAQQTQLQAELSAAHVEVGEVRSRLATLIETQDSLEGFDRGVSAALEEQRDGTFSEPLRLVGELLHVPPAYERALEAALGEAVQVLVTEHEATAHRVFEWLRANAQGRASVLPRELLRPEAEVRSLPEAVGRASELVECDPGHRGFVNALLGNLWLVRDHEAALAARAQAPGCAVVTLAGVVYHANGLITGGEEQTIGGYISRRREIDELTARVATLEVSIADGEERLAAMTSALVATVEAGARLEAERVRTLSSLAALEREVDHFRRECNRLDRQREQVEADQQDLAAEATREEAERAQHEQALTGLEAERAQLDLDVAAGQFQVSDAARQRDEASQAMAEIRVQQSAARERLVAVEKFQTDLMRQSEATRREIDDKRETVQRGVAEDRTLREQIVADQAALVGWRAQHAEAEAAFDGWRRERLGLVEELDLLGTQLRAERTQVHEAETELHKLDLRETQTRTEMEEAERRFREEFELTIEQALGHAGEIENKQAALEEQATLRQQLSMMSNLNLGALAQQEALTERLEFLTTQRDDLEQGKSQLEEIIAEIDGRTREQFLTTFEAIQREFDYMFVRIFDGGSTRLSLTDPDNLLESGVEVRVQLPGKAEQDLMALSGGERALTALSLLLALLRVKPSPFCVLDEVDAPLDQNNVGRFSELLREFGARTQFIIITHNNGTMEAADVLYGVTMQEQGVSRLVSLRLVDAVR